MTVISILDSVIVIGVSCAALLMFKDKQQYQVTEPRQSDFGDLARSVMDLQESSVELRPPPCTPIGDSSLEPVASTKLS